MTINKSKSLKVGKIIKLSASAIGSYEQCPKKYYFQYIERLPKKQWAHFDLGNLCHKTLEIFYYVIKNNKIKKPLSEVMSYSFSEARKKFPKINNIFLAEAKDMLTKHLQTLDLNNMPKIKNVEKSFEFKISKNILVRGILDRLDLEDENFHIIDYKTTKNIKYLKDFQLLVYGLWLKKKYSSVQNFKGSYVLLRHNSTLKSYEFNIEDIRRVKKELLSYAERIKNDNTWITIPSPLCDWCDFKPNCPAQSW